MTITVASVTLSSMAFSKFCRHNYVHYHHFFWLNLDYFVLVLFAFVVMFSFFSTVPIDWLGIMSLK